MSGRSEIDARPKNNDGAAIMMTLYWAPGTAAFAPEVVLEESKVAYEKVVVPLREGAHRQDDYLAINPHGTVPTLILDDGTVMTQAAAMVLYLADRFPRTKLAPLPDDPRRPAYLDWMAYLTNTVQAASKRYYFPHRYSTDDPDSKRIKAKAQADLLGQWEVIDRHLDSDGPYLTGGRCTAADIFAAMLASWFEPQARLHKTCGNVRYLMELVSARPAVARVQPAHG